MIATFPAGILNIILPRITIKETFFKPLLRGSINSFYIPITSSIATCNSTCKPNRTIEKHITDIELCFASLVLNDMVYL